MLNFDINLILVGVAITANLILGFVVFSNDYKSATSRLFLLQTAILSCWSVANYVSYQSSLNLSESLLWVRLVLFFAVPNSIVFMLLMHTFPKQKLQISKPKILIISFVTIATMLLTLSPLVFSDIIIAPGSVAPQPIVQPGIAVFMLVAVLSIPVGFYFLIRKFIYAKNTEKIQFRFLLTGVLIMFAAIILFNFVFPTFLQNTSLIPLSALFTLPFIIFTAYAIIKYKLFNVKVIATELIVFALWVFILMRTLVSATPEDRIVNGLLLVAVIIIGIFLIRSVMREVKQREQLEIITGQLEAANEQLKSLDKLKTEFLSLAAHQLRSPLTAMKGYASMILEGSYGEVPEKQKEPINRIFESSNHLAKVINDFLNVSKIEQGGMKYEMAPFDVEKAAHDLATDLAVTAKNKGLELTFSTDNQPPYTSYGDMEKLRQVFLNLIDNSIKYTAQGFIKVKIEKNVAAGTITFSVTDSGMGISKETMATLFQKFARGEGGKVNTSGSGLGLYLAKEIVAAHKGRVWIESPGVGKGSTFFVELPMNKS